MKCLNVLIKEMIIGHFLGKRTFGVFEGGGGYGGWESRGRRYSREHAGVKASPRVVKAGGS